MEDSRWIAEEQRLWNAVMYPRRRKITAHSLPKDSPQRRHVQEEIDKARRAEFANGWWFFREFINHGRPD
jgi:hypothetical protein